MAAAVIWFASLMRSPPLNMFSLKMLVKLKSLSAAVEHRQLSLIAKRDVEVVQARLQRLHEVAPADRGVALEAGSGVHAEDRNVRVADGTSLSGIGCSAYSSSRSWA